MNDQGAVHRNYIPTSTGKVRAVCEFCNKKSAPVTADADGEPNSYDLALGWTVGPYPPTTVHPDGSVGSLWTCPSCQRRLRRGERLRTRDGRVAWEVG